jgi:hemerythrin-like domain-containing protein
MGRMSRATLPGARSPIVGFDQPFELLAACHDRLRQRLDLLARLVEHLGDHGPDAAARDAAADVLRYFDVAAPHHHEDEERHLVPVLKTSGNPADRAAAQRLLDDHAQIQAAWQGLRPLLLQLEGDPAALRRAARHFIALHGPHLALEDDLVYPAAQQRIGAAEAVAIGTEMARRRGATRPDPAS